MKRVIFTGRSLALLAATCVFPATAGLAAEKIDSSPPVVQTTTTVRLPYGVGDILKLSRAQVSEDVILNYIQNSGTAYNLGATEIVYLRNEGVSDRVLTAMLDQKRRVIETATTNAQVAQAQAPGSTQIYNVQQAPVQPAPVYVQYPPPEPASTVHVIPYPAARAAYYGTSGYYPYLRYPYYAYGYPGYSGYSGYWWGGPSISLGFGFGFGGYHHHHHGWHGGW